MELTEYTIPAAARVAGVGVSRMRKYVREGVIHGYRTPGGHYRIPHMSIIAWRESRKNTPVQTPTLDDVWVQRMHTIRRNGMFDKT